MPVVCIGRIGLTLVVTLCLTGCAVLSGRVEQPARANLSTPAVPPVDVHEQVMSDVLAAELAVQAEDWPTASRAYARAAMRSDDPEVAAAAARLAAGQGEPAQAQAAIERMRATGADPLALAREEARLALLRGHREQARAALLRLLQPGGAKAWADVGQILAEGRDPALSGVLLESLATEQPLPDDAVVWLAMSRLGAQLQRHRYAQHLALAAAQRFNSGQTYAWAAHLQLAAGDTKQGLALYAKAVQADPDSVALRRAYAHALGEAEAYRKALDVLRDAGTGFEVLASRAAYAARLEDKQELQAVYQLLQAHRDDADYPPQAAFLLGQLADALGKADEAIDYYAQVPAGDAQAFDAQLRRVVLLAGRGDGERAHVELARLRQVFAQDSEKLRQLYLVDAHLYARAGQADQAVAAYDRGLAEFPEDIPLLYGRAISDADRGRTQAAVATFRRILELAPDDTDAMNALGYTLADQHGDLDEARRLLRKALNANPEEPAIQDSWGWLQYRLGNLDEAARYLRMAWQARQDTDIGLHLGEVLWQAGQHDAARAVFAQLREQGDAALDAQVDALEARLQP